MVVAVVAVVVAVVPNWLLQIEEKQCLKNHCNIEHIEHNWLLLLLLWLVVVAVVVAVPKTYGNFCFVVG